MTHERPDIGSVQDLTYAFAQDRIAELRASAMSGPRRCRATRARFAWDRHADPRCRRPPADRPGRLGGRRRAPCGSAPCTSRSRPVPRTMAGMTATTDRLPVHRRRRGRPPARQPTAGPADRLRARPAGDRPEGVQRPARAAAPASATWTRRGSPRPTPQTLDAGLPDATGPAPVPGLDGRQGPGAGRARSPPTTATTPRRIWTEAADGPDLKRRLLGPARASAR